MKMGEQIPPEVRNDIRLHLDLCVDLALLHMIGKSNELFDVEGGRTTGESALCLVPFNQTPVSDLHSSGIGMSCLTCSLS